MCLAVAACDAAAADEDCCTSSAPCGLHEGDCDTDADCAGALVCGIDNCNNMGLGFPSDMYDCCVPGTVCMFVQMMLRESVTVPLHSSELCVFVQLMLYESVTAPLHSRKDSCQL